MLSNQQSAHQLVSFSILSTLQGRRRFQPRLQFSPLFKLRVLRYFANEAVAMVASARREKPHIASQPASHIDSRSATASLYLTQAQGATMSSNKAFLPRQLTRAHYEHLSEEFLPVLSFIFSFACLLVWRGVGEQIVVT